MNVPSYPFLKFACIMSTFVPLINCCRVAVNKLCDGLTFTLVCLDVQRHLSKICICYGSNISSRVPMVSSLGGSTMVFVEILCVLHLYNFGELWSLHVIHSYSIRASDCSQRLKLQACGSSLYNPALDSD